MGKYLLGFLAGILVLPLGVFIMGWLGFLPANADSEPPGWETSFARMARDAYIVRHAPHEVNPFQPTEANLMAGYKIFEDACAGCHDSGWGHTFYPHVPQLATTPPTLPDWQLFYLVKHGVRYSAMPAWDRSWHGGDAAVSDDHMWKAVTFLSHLNSLPPSVQAEWKKSMIR